MREWSRTLRLNKVKFAKCRTFTFASKILNLQPPATTICWISSRTKLCCFPISSAGKVVFKTLAGSSGSITAFACVLNSHVRSLNVHSSVLRRAVDRLTAPRALFSEPTRLTGLASVAKVKLVAQPCFEFGEHLWNEKTWR